MKKVSIFNIKGGVAKTTSTANLGACLSQEGKKRPVKQEVDHVYQMDKVKYTKYIISFN